MTPATKDVHLFESQRRPREPATLNTRAGSLPVPAYLAQDSVQTLAEGLREYESLSGGPSAERNASVEARGAHERNLDICRVVFGLSPAPRHDALTSVVVLLSTDVGWKAYRRYLSRPRKAHANAPPSKFNRDGSVQWSGPRIVRALIQGLSARRRWPWNAPDRFMIRSLKHLRREYGIKVL